MELTHKDLTLKQITQLILVELYKNYQTHKGSSDLHMSDVIKVLGFKEWDDRIYQAQDLLEEMGFADCSMKTSDGLAIPKLLPNAIVYMEETGDVSLGGATKMSDKIILNFFHKIENSQINTQSHHNTQNNIVNDTSIFDKMIDVINTTNEINPTDKGDLLSDIAIIKHEVSKTKPDKSLILSKIELMSKFVPLIPLIPALHKLIESIFK